MDFEQEVEVCIRSRFTFICVVSFEEERVLEQLRSVCDRTKRTLLAWDHADFFQTLSQGAASPPAAKDPVSVLEAIEKMEGEVVFVIESMKMQLEVKSPATGKVQNVHVTAGQILAGLDVLATLE